MVGVGKKNREKWRDRENMYVIDKIPLIYILSRKQNAVQHCNMEYQNHKPCHSSTGMWLCIEVDKPIPGELYAWYCIV